MLLSSNMEKVTILKTEYTRLKRQAQAYRNVVGKIFDMAIKDPVHEVIRDFRETKLYNEKFLKDLESGLRKSSYSKRYGNKAAKKRS